MFADLVMSISPVIYVVGFQDHIVHIQHCNDNFWMAERRAGTGKILESQVAQARN